MKKNVISFVLAGIVAFSVNAQSKLEDLVSAENAKKLRETGRIELIHEKEDFDLHIVPDCEYKSKIEKEVIAKDLKSVPFVAEFLYLVPKADLLKGSNKTNITVSDMSVVMRSISKMKGMTYVHNNGKRTDVLYKEAYTIDGENSLNKIADKIEGSADGLVSYCYQKDNTYGDTFYVLNYKENSTSVYGTFLNTAPLQYLGVKAIMPRDMKISIASFDCGDSLLLYIACDCNAKQVPLFNVRKQILESMTCRMEAIFKWFMGQF